MVLGDCLFSLTIMLSRLIHNIACTRTIIHFCGWIVYSTIWIWFIHSSDDGHLSCFHCLAVTNNTAFCAQLGGDICFHFSSEQPGVELLGQMVTPYLTDSCYLISFSFFLFLKLFLSSISTTYHPHNFFLPLVELSLFSSNFFLSLVGKLYIL